MLKVQADVGLEMWRREGRECHHRVKGIGLLGPTAKARGKKVFLNGRK